MIALILQYNLIQFISVIGGILLTIGICLGFLIYGIRLGKSKVEEHRIRPFKEAAEGWEALAEQSKAEIADLKNRLAELERKIEENKVRERKMERERDELKDDLIFAARANFKLQGEIERLNSRVSTLEAFHKGNN